MRIVPSCEKCLLDRQIARAGEIEDPVRREEFIQKIRELMENRKEEDSAPYMVYQFGKIARDYFGPQASYKEIKEEYNSLVMYLEKEVEEKIENSPNPLETSMIYGRIGNYIDFGAMNSVSKEEFFKLLDDKGKEGIDREVFREFTQECEKGKTFLLLCDNCGEIILDKLFLRQLKKAYPHLKVYAMVRGEEALNDATLEDASFCGIDREAELLTNGCGVTGTVIEMLPPREREIFEKADIVYSKGQGNYETLAGCNRAIYYSFLCKCDHFVNRFEVPRLTGMFVKEG